MKYKLNSYIVSKMNSEIIVRYDGYEKTFSSGEELSMAEFDKYYIIESITAENNIFIITLIENKSISDCCDVVIAD